MALHRKTSLGAAFTAPERKVLTGKGSGHMGRTGELFSGSMKMMQINVQLGFCCTPCCKPLLWPTVAISVFDLFHVMKVGGLQ